MRKIFSFKLNRNLGLSLATFTYESSIEEEQERENSTLILSHMCHSAKLNVLFQLVVNFVTSHAMILQAQRAAW